MTSLSELGARVRRFMNASLRGGEGVDSFETLALELFARQFEGNCAYRHWCEARGLRPGKVREWSGIPAMPTVAFKELEVSSLEVKERVKVFHSSGTTGQTPSQHYHSEESLRLYAESAWSWFEEWMVPGTVAELVVLTPRPADAPRSSLVHMFETVRQRLGQDEGVFVGEAGHDGWRLEGKRVWQRIEAAGGQPILMLGTALTFVHLLEGMVAEGVRLRLPAGSRVMETGGYKGRSRELSRAELHGLMTERLGIAEEEIVCEYGMSELSSQGYAGSEKAGHGKPPHPYPSPKGEGNGGPENFSHPYAKGEGTENSPHPCPSPEGEGNRVFRFPPWARVRVVSPETGREVGDGEVGLVRVFDLANVWSVLAVQTEDLGVKRGDGFELVGRAVMAEARGCSLNAA